MARQTRRRPGSEERLGSAKERLRARQADAVKSAPARRISVIGATGSGKSVLARRLSDEWRLPLYELDAIFWDGNGRALPNGEFIKAVADLTEGGAWVLDGHYRAVRELIWRRSEMVIWLNYPLLLVGYRLLRRFVKKRRAARDREAPETQAGEELDERRAQASATWHDRLSRLARTISERREYGRLLNAPEYRSVEVVELKSPRAAENFIRTGMAPSTRSTERSGRNLEA